jgi:hypothetical protein
MDGNAFVVLLIFSRNEKRKKHHHFSKERLSATMKLHYSQLAAALLLLLADTSFGFHSHSQVKTHHQIRNGGSHSFNNHGVSSFSFKSIDPKTSTRLVQMADASASADEGKKKGFLGKVGAETKVVSLASCGAGRVYHHERLSKYVQTWIWACQPSPVSRVNSILKDVLLTSFPFLHIYIDQGHHPTC